MSSNFSSSLKEATFNPNWDSAKTELIARTILERVGYHTIRGSLNSSVYNEPTEGAEYNHLYTRDFLEELENIGVKFEKKDQHLKKFRENNPLDEKEIKLIKSEEEEFNNEYEQDFGALDLKDTDFWENVDEELEGCYYFTNLEKHNSTCTNTVAAGHIWVRVKWSITTSDDSVYFLLTLNENFPRSLIERWSKDCYLINTISITEHIHQRLENIPQYLISSFIDLGLELPTDITKVVNISKELNRKNNGSFVFDMITGGETKEPGTKVFTLARLVWLPNRNTGGGKSSNDCANLNGTVVAKSLISYYNSECNQIGPTILLFEVGKEYQGRKIGKILYFTLEAWLRSTLVEAMEGPTLEVGFRFMVTRVVGDGFWFFPALGFADYGGVSEKFKNVSYSGIKG